MSASAICEQKIGHLDGWRGTAILLVLIGHFFPIPGIDLGRLGVNWFFVLSGLLMGRLLFIRSTAIPLFYRRRVTRIFPLFYVFLFLMLAWGIFSGKNINGQALLSSAFFIRNYFALGAESSIIPTGHLWSLAVEEQSYIFLSLLALLVRHTRAKAIHVLAVTVAMSGGLIVFYEFYCPTKQDLYYMSLHGEYAGFGIFASALVLLLARPFHGANWIVPGLIISGSLLHWWSVPMAIQSVVGISALALAVNLLDAGPQWIRTILNFLPLRMLGIWSFSLYLWQQVFYASSLPRPTAFAVAILTGIVSFYLLEQPARKWLNSVWANENYKQTKATYSAKTRTSAQA